MKIKIGDIIEFETKHGFSYAQFYQNHVISPGLGALLRVLPGFFTKRPNNFIELAKSKEIFSVFFCIQAAVNKKIVQVVGNVEIPPHARGFPLFRVGFPNQETGKVEKWMLWDGVKQWKIVQLTDEQLDLPIRGIVSYPMLLERLEMGWTPRRADEFIDRARAQSKRSMADVGLARKVKEMRHYLIVNDRESGERAIALIYDLGLEAGLTRLGLSWGIEVPQPDLTPDEVNRITQCLEEVASAAGGTYDGNRFKFG